VADVDGLALDPAAVDFEHVVLEHGRVVVQLALEYRPLGDLNKFRRDLDAAPFGELGIRARASRTLSPVGTSNRHQTHGKHEAHQNGPVGTQTHEFFASRADGRR
jgi:hypothetical protein